MTGVRQVVAAASINAVAAAAPVARAQREIAAGSSRQAALPGSSAELDE